MRRNTKEFKRVLKILKQYYNDPGAIKVIKLYALRPTESLDKKILINALKRNRDVLYNMNYNSILTSLESNSLKLYREDEEPLFYFKTSSDSDWYELPFEFIGQAKQDFQKFFKSQMILVK